MKFTACLKDEGKLLDFDFKNEDIESLRQQMQLSGHVSSPFSDSPPSPPGKSLDPCLVLPSASTMFLCFDLSRVTTEPPSPPKHILSPDSSLSDIPPPPLKRRRTSQTDSSLSEAEDEDEDDEDQPLAARARVPVSTNGSMNGMRVRRGGKKSSGKKGVSHTSLPSEQPHSALDGAAKMNGRQTGGKSHDAKVKMEDRLDDKQLTRLATGVTVDTGMTAPTPVCVDLLHVFNIFLTNSHLKTVARPEKAVYVEMRQGLIQVIAVENDKTPRSLIILTGLKTLFQKQLPKMPREYIARLVYDANSKALAIVKHGYKVVGGICYRPFPQRGFAEIVFFATASVDQVKVSQNIVNNSHLGSHYSSFVFVGLVGIWWDVDEPLQSAHPGNVPRYDALPYICRQLCRRLFPQARIFQGYHARSKCLGWIHQGL